MNSNRFPPGSPATESRLENERGAVLVLMAFAMFVFLGVAALAIDLGLLFVARGEAQRAADAAAHAGAGFYQVNRNEAEVRFFVRDFAADNNSVRGMPVDLDPADIEVDTDDLLVRVNIRQAVPTLFARILGFSQVDIGASAAAQLFAATGAACVLPIMMPDQINGRPIQVGDSIQYRLQSAAPPRPGWAVVDTRDLGRPNWYGTVYRPGGGFSGQAAGGMSNPNPGSVAYAVENCEDGSSQLIIGDNLRQSSGNMNSVRGAFQRVQSGDPALFHNGCVRDNVFAPCRSTAGGRYRPVFLFDSNLDLSPGGGPGGAGGTANTPIPIVGIAGVFLEEVSQSSPYFLLLRVAPIPGLGVPDGAVDPLTPVTTIRIVE